VLLELQRELALESDIGTVLGRITAAATSLLGAERALAQRIDGTAGTHVLTRSVDATRRLSPEAEAGAFHVIREAVTNAIKTGRASTVSIDVRDDGAGLTALVEDLSFRSVTSRVAKILLQQGREASLQITQQELAAMAGTAREVVGRALKALEERGAIRLERGRILVLDRRALAEAI